jgi:hypothetical protein
MARTRSTFNRAAPTPPGPTHRWIEEKKRDEIVGARFDGDVSISIHRMHGVPDTWFVSCYPVNISSRELAAKTLEAAKAEGTEACRTQVERSLQAIRRAESKLGA